jgi:multicomponent Na+:H+ antiporter subunit F
MTDGAAHILAGGLVGLTLALALALGRLLAGPTLPDRLSAFAVVSTLVALIVAGLAVLAGQAVWIDVGLAVALVGFVGGLGLYKAVRRRGFQAPIASPQTEEPR